MPNLWCSDTKKLAKYPWPTWLWVQIYWVHTQPKFYFITGMTRRPRTRSRRGLGKSWSRDKKRERKQGDFDTCPAPHHTDHHVSNCCYRWSLSPQLLLLFSLSSHCPTLLHILFLLSPFPFFLFFFFGKIHFCLLDFSCFVCLFHMRMIHDGK